MNLSKNKRNLSIRSILFISSIVLMVLSLVGFFKILPIFDIFTTTIGYTTNNFKSGVNDFFLRFEENQSIAKENIDLRKQLIRQDAEISKLNLQKTDFESLQKLSSIAVPKKEMIMSHTISVIFSDRVPISIQIDKGEKEGIKEGQIVINDTGSLIGIISSTNLFTANITPYYKLDYKVPIKSQNTQTSLIDGIKMSEVAGVDLSQNNTIKAGDSFFTSSLNDKIPEGIYVGTLSKFDNEDKKKFFLKTDILNIDILYILK